MNRILFAKYTSSSLASLCLGIGISNHISNPTQAKELNIVPILCHDGATVIPYELPSRKQQLAKLQKSNEEFDVLIIGGGATGAGCALDAATRGLKVALVERDDFSAGTSGRSTKLIHGGIRYLEAAFKRLDYGSYQLVQEALEERAHMLSVASYMNRPLPIMIPIYTWWEIPYMWIGAKVYDFLAGSKRFVPGSFYMSAEEAMFQFPMLNSTGLKGAIVYYDGQMNDTRMNLTIALTAVQGGAVSCNYVEVVRLLKNEDGKLCGAVLKDNLSKKEWEIKAKAIVNACGPFTDGIRKMDNPEIQDLVIPAAGVHIVLPDHFSPQKMGLIVPKTKDGRVLFFLPWEHATVAGTTDSVTDITMKPSPTEEEIDFIITEANRYLAKPVSKTDVLSAWSGIRPLVRDPSTLGENTSQISRNHVLEVSDSNLVSIAGGKWTTYRRMAEDTIDKVLTIVPSLGVSASKCQTKDAKLLGADRVGQVCGQKFDVITVTLRQKYQMGRYVAEHLTRNYGTRALQIAEIQRHGYLNRKPMDGEMRRLVSNYPYLEAEVVFAVRQEYAVKAVDVIARRTRLAYIDTNAASIASKKVVEIMGALLGWSKDRKNQELLECEDFLKTMHKK